MRSMHFLWLGKAIVVGLCAASFFGIILCCGGALAIASGFTPWIEALPLFVSAGLGVIAARGSWALSQEQFRAENMQCIRCGYSLIALTSGICPECGKLTPYG